MPDADLALTREFMRSKSMDVFNNASLGVVADVRHRTVFHDKRDSENKWFYGQMPMKDSAVIVWPMERKSCKCGVHGMLHYFEPDFKKQRHPFDADLIL